MKGHLHTYRIMGTEAYYIDFSSMPKMMMEERLGYTYHPELVTGELMIKGKTEAIPYTWGTVLSDIPRNNIKATR